MVEIIIAGFGGQGVLLMGQLIAYGCMIEDKEVSWFPSYGPEQRGGTCNCSVVVSDREIGSPIVSKPTTLITMNGPSLQRFEPQVVPGGLLVYNSTLIPEKPKRKDIQVMAVPANEVGEELGNTRVANMVLLGALIKRLQLMERDSVEQALTAVLAQRHHHLIPLNMQAFDRGREYQ